MTRAIYGMLMGMMGSAIAFWIWRRQSPAGMTPRRGRVIYRNTPVAPDEGV
jgi:hypothetical protein